MNENLKFKVIIIGDSGCGKSNLLLQFTEKKHYSDYVMTIGVDLGIKTIKLNDEIITLNVWDTCGHEYFRALSSSYYKASKGCILMYDITRRETFKNIDKWMNEIIKYSGSDMRIILVGNKIDIEKNNRNISFEEGKNYADKNNILFMETSAKKNINVENVFLTLANEINMKLKNEIIEKNMINLEMDNKEKNCCHK